MNQRFRKSTSPWGRFVSVFGTLCAVLWMPIILAAPQGASESPVEKSQETQAPEPTVEASEEFTDVVNFLQLLSQESSAREAAFDRIREGWKDTFAPMMIETSRFVRDSYFAPKLIRLLEKKTGQRHSRDYDGWYQWLWDNEPLVHPRYGDFKAALYSFIDPKFGGYFSVDRTTKIRLDEVRWGGVAQDGIPPLRSPKMIPAAEATYLEDDHVVFGLGVGDDVRAYPKRILAWHEMFVDTVGGVPVAGVYCTLCGSMILYETLVEEVQYELGTSGFLYRSNKLMYDQATQSLWNTLWGRPVIGPLADKDITLPRRSVVTTTWGQWRKRHPNTTVLSLDTGYDRDYGEGVAYKDYFATDQLMFTVPKEDRRLKNKAEILAIVFDRFPDQPLAIAARYLARNTIYHDKIGDQAFVVFTDPSGANRVYETRGERFKSWDGDHAVVDDQGKKWRLGEEKLQTEDGQSLKRLPAHRAFWFGWYAAYPQTRLVR